MERKSRRKNDPGEVARHLRSMKHLAPLAALALLGGCAHFTPHPLDTGASASALTGRALGGRTWTLTALMDEAVKHHPEIAVARAQYETATAAVETAGERPNPTVSLSPQIVTPYTTWIAGTYGVDFDWTFETAGKRTKRMEGAHAQARAAAAHVIDATWKVRAAVRKALLELYAAERRTQLLNDAITRQTEVLKLMEERITAGAEPRSGLAQPRLLQAQLRLQAADAQKAAALGRASLAEALGMGVNGLAGATFSYAAFEHAPAAKSTHRREALTRRADVLEALANYAAAESALRLEVAKQYPDVHLNPGYQLDQGENKWALGIGLTLPILNQNRGVIAEAEGKRKEAAAKFNAVQAKVLAECDRAAAQVSAARAKLATTEEMMAEQEKQVASEERFVAAGEGDKLALLSAQVERATTLTARLDAQVDLQAALGSLEEATQSPLSK